MALECLLVLMVVCSMKVCGRMAFRRVKARKRGRMELNTKENIKPAKNTATANTAGMMAPLTKAKCKITNFTVTALTPTQAEIATQVSLMMDSCMAKAFTHGKMGDTMKETTRKIEGKVMGSLRGQTANNIKVCGKIINSMVMGST